MVRTSTYFTGKPNLLHTRLAEVWSGFWIRAINICNFCVRQMQWALKRFTEVHYNNLNKSTE